MSTPSAQSVAARDEPEGARQIGPAKAFIANLEPDWCFVDPARTELVAFNIVAAFQDDVRPHRNVRMTYLPTVTKVSRISAVVGNEAGIGGGLRSSVCKGWCRPVDGCASVLINGQRVIRHDDLYWMNCDGPEGPANCLGEVIYLVQGAGGHAYDAATGEEVILGRDLWLPVLRPETAAEASWLQKTLSSPAVLFTLGALQVLGGAAEVVVAVGVGGGAELFSGGIATPVALPAAALIGAHGLSEIYAGAEMMVTLTPTQTPAAAGMAWGLEQAGYQRDRAELVGSLLDAAMGIGIGLGGSKLITGAPKLAQETGGLVDDIPVPGGTTLVDGPSPAQAPVTPVQSPAEGLTGDVWSRSDEGLLYLDDGPRVPLAYDGSGNSLYTVDEVSKALGDPAGAGLKVTGISKRELEALYGKARPPTWITPFEQNADESTILNPTVQSSANGSLNLEPGKAYLWGITPDGALVIAEEILSPIGTKPYHTLGHPTLTAGGDLLSGGEINSVAGGGWEMNNLSGRYNMGNPNTLEQLENARRLLEVSSDALSSGPVTVIFKH